MKLMKLMSIFSISEPKDFEAVIAQLVLVSLLRPCIPFEYLIFPLKWMFLTFVFSKLSLKLPPLSSCKIESKNWKAESDFINHALQHWCSGIHVIFQHIAHSFESWMGNIIMILWIKVIYTEFFEEVTSRNGGNQNKPDYFPSESTNFNC